MNEMTVYDQNQDVQVYRDPTAVLADAKRAATALAQVVAGKKKPVIMNGEQYLEFEDWQTVGRFYGVTAKVVSTEFMDLSGVQGFQAKAVAIRADGMEVSAAESMCLNDEPNWKSKPLFQLRSMAQTRACAKALRNVLAWVVVLAGYKPTPAEEIQDMVAKPPIKEPAKKTETVTPECVTTPVSNVESKTGTNPKTKKDYTLYGIAGEDGAIYKTFDAALADLARTAQEDGVPVKIAYTVGKYGNDIKSLEIAEREPGSDDK
jgi:hypothetical protein